MHISDYFKTNLLFDSHAHLTNYISKESKEIQQRDLKLIVSRATQNNVGFILDMGVNIQSSKQVIENAITFKDKIFAFVGIDPEIFIPGTSLFIVKNLSNDWFDNSYNSLKKLIEKHRNVIKGVGECGIDFYWLKNLNKMDAERSKSFQLKLFDLHLNLAEAFNLPLSIHSRGAENECLMIVKSRQNIRGIFHSYTGSYDVAKKILDIGWGLGINGISTFKKGDLIREMYKKIIGDIKLSDPQEFYNKGLFFETDSPFLSPEGKRGEVNEPSNTKIIFDSFVKTLIN